MNQTTTSSEIDRYLRTGDYDPLLRAWPGRHVLESIEAGSRALRDALIKELRCRKSRVPGKNSVAPSGDDLIAFTRAKVEPMVRGLFPRKEAEPVLALLERSVVFVTPKQVEPLIEKARLGTAWAIANIYLGSIGAERLDGKARGYVGLSEETTCYVSLEYFAADDPFADFVVHEAAHMFHNNKRRMAGLPETRRRQWLLPIEFGKRETFAYACEAYSCIRERSRRPADRRALFEELKTLPTPPDDRVDLDEYFSMLDDAVARRNGWKAILEACSVQRS
jgi:hypothetical protein